MYSFSFHQNPYWTRFWAKQEEILAYINGVSQYYDINPHIKYNIECVAANWNNSSHRWNVEFINQLTGERFSKSCKFFVGAGGVLSNPKDCPIPGKEDFKGPVFHSAEWRQDVDLKGKNIVLLGNGCSATQIMPVISQDAKHVTQFIRSPHHIVPLPLPNSERPWIIKMMCAYVPFFQWFLRICIFLYLDFDFNLFYSDGWIPKMLRSIRQKISLNHIKKNAPPKYLDMLLPDFDFGSKRRVLDTDYLKCLHQDNVTLTNERAIRITKNGIRLFHIETNHYY